MGTENSAENTAAIDEHVRKAMELWNVPGASVAVVRGDEVIYLKGFGVREFGTDSPVTPDTLFAIGSTTKAVTTTAMAMLVDEGKMAWDDPVRKHIPWFRLSDPLADANVTLRDLVCHRTGLSRHDVLWYRSPYSREDVVRRIGFCKPNTSFRSKWEYNNIMFIAAGCTVGLASGGTWEEFVRRRIFEPLGIKGANFSTHDAERAPDHAEPHHRRRDDTLVKVPWCNLDNTAPAGAINAGARDLSQWLRFQLGQGVFEGKRLVSEANFRETWTPQMVVRTDEVFRGLLPETVQVTYALGWSISDYRAHHQVSHGGGIDGFRANVTLFPRDNLGIAVLANLGNSAMTEALCNNLADMLLGLPEKDWNAVFLELRAKGKEKQIQADKEREEKRHPDTKPSLDLAAYVGAYEEPAYGTAHVSMENGALALQWSFLTVPLEHYHHDTFLYRIEPFEQTDMVSFALGTDGDGASMKLLDNEFAKVRPRPEPAKA